MKTLIIVSRPNIEESTVQNFLKASLPKDENITWNYVDNNEINIKLEQRLLLENDHIIFQFPLYWYSAPAEMKRWIDLVLDGDFAFSGNNLLEGKELGVVVSTGIAEKQFQAGGKENFSISEMLRPFEMMANKLKMKYLRPIVISQFEYKSDTEKMDLLIEYQQYLQLTDFSFSAKLDWFINQSEQRDLNIISETLVTKKNRLEDLNWQVQLLRESDGEG